MSFELESVGMPAPPRTGFTAIVCDRSPKSFDTIRKFKADCGNMLEVSITRTGKVRSIVGLDHETKGCPACEDRKAKIRTLIEAGK